MNRQTNKQNWLTFERIQTDFILTCSENRHVWRLLFDTSLKDLYLHSRSVVWEPFSLIFKRMLVQEVENRRGRFLLHSEYSYPHPSTHPPHPTLFLSSLLSIYPLPCRRNWTELSWRELYSGRSVTEGTLALGRTKYSNTRYSGIVGSMPVYRAPSSPTGKHSPKNLFIDHIVLGGPPYRSNWLPRNLFLDRFSGEPLHPFSIAWGTSLSTSSPSFFLWDRKANNQLKRGWKKMAQSQVQWTTFVRKGESKSVRFGERNDIDILPVCLFLLHCLSVWDWKRERERGGEGNYIDLEVSQQKLPGGEKEVPPTPEWEIWIRREEGREVEGCSYSSVWHCTSTCGCAWKQHGGQPQTYVGPTCSPTKVITPFSSKLTPQGQTYETFVTEEPLSSKPQMIAVLVCYQGKTRFLQSTWWDTSIDGRMLTVVLEVGVCIHVYVRARMIALACFCVLACV